MCLNVPECKTCLEGAKYQALNSGVYFGNFSFFIKNSF
jgi:hypothetical protein